MRDNADIRAEIMERLQALSDTHSGEPTTFSEVVAHTAFWMASFSAAYGDDLIALLVLSDAMRSVTVHVYEGEDAKRGN